MAASAAAVAAKEAAEEVAARAAEAYAVARASASAAASQDPPKSAAAEGLTAARAVFATAIRKAQDEHRASPREELVQRLVALWLAFADFEKQKRQWRAAINVFDSAALTAPTSQLSELWVKFAQHRRDRARPKKADDVFRKGLSSLQGAEKEATLREYLAFRREQYPEDRNLTLDMLRDRVRNLATWESFPEAEKTPVIQELRAKRSKRDVETTAAAAAAAAPAVEAPAEVAAVEAETQSEEAAAVDRDVEFHGVLTTEEQLRERSKQAAMSGSLVVLEDAPSPEATNKKRKREDEDEREEEGQSEAGSTNGSMLARASSSTSSTVPPVDGTSPSASDPTIATAVPEVGGAMSEFATEAGVSVGDMQPKREDEDNGGQAVQSETGAMSEFMPASSLGPESTAVFTLDESSSSNDPAGTALVPEVEAATLGPDEPPSTAGIVLQAPPNAPLPERYLEKDLVQELQHFVEAHGNILDIIGALHLLHDLATKDEEYTRELVDARVASCRLAHKAAVQASSTPASMHGIVSARAAQDEASLDRLQMAVVRQAAEAMEGVRAVQQRALQQAGVPGVHESADPVQIRKHRRIVQALVRMQSTPWLRVPGQSSQQRGERGPLGAAAAASASAAGVETERGSTVPASSARKILDLLRKQTSTDS